MIRFSSKEEKLEWLKNTGIKIKEMEVKRAEAIMKKEFNSAFGLLKGIQFAKSEFRAVSKTLKNDFAKNGTLA